MQRSQSSGLMLLDASGGPGDAGIVHEHVDRPPMPVQRGLEQLPSRAGSVGDIAVGRVMAGSVRREFGDRLPIDVADVDRGAFLDEGARPPRDRCRLLPP